MATQNDRQNRETYLVNMMYGTYADVLFILFPFLVMALQRLWSGDGINILKYADLSVAAAILAGMAVGKFVLGLISERDLGRFKERIVFFIAVTLFFVLGPSLILITKIVNADEVPHFVVFVQPILLIVAISLYSAAVSISNLLTRPGSRHRSSVDESSEEAGDETDTLHIDSRLPSDVAIGK
ncbi:MAG: hypothetical protein H6999_07140 [Hahellaceae bacterium]|nr:hypothetical protein [Hahellaceae bacterium]